MECSGEDSDAHFLPTSEGSQDVMSVSGERRYSM